MSSLKTDAVISPAQTRVALGYCLGKVQKEIAAWLHISTNTVNRHTQDIYEAAEIPHSTNALVAWFLTQNYGIDLKELGRRIGAGVLMLIFCLTVATADDQLARRSRSRRGRRNETEYVVEM